MTFDQLTANTNTRAVIAVATAAPLFTSLGVHLQAGSGLGTGAIDAFVFSLQDATGLPISASSWAVNILAVTIGCACYLIKRARPLISWKNIYLFVMAGLWLQLWETVLPITEPESFIAGLAVWFAGFFVLIGALSVIITFARIGFGFEVFFYGVAFVTGRDLNAIRWVTDLAAAGFAVLLAGFAFVNLGTALGFLGAPALKLLEPIVWRTTSRWFQTGDAIAKA